MTLKPGALFNPKLLVEGALDTLHMLLQVAGYHLKDRTLSMQGAKKISLPPALTKLKARTAGWI